MLEKIKENPLDYKGYFEYAKYLENVNLKQAYLTYENALFYCQDELIRIEIQNKLDEIAYRQGKVEPASIVILSYNNHQLTQQCIESIRETTPASAREIVIVDNNSQDDSVEYLRQQDDIVLVENDFNAGFPGGCNIGIKASRKENDIFLLNNDTILCANSLYTLRMGLYERDNYGAAGCVTNNASNNQTIIEDNLTIDEYKEFGLKTNVCEKKYEYKLMLIGFAILIKRQVLNIVGLLDEQFSPGNYEDDDYGLRVLKAGFQNVLVHNSFIIHLGGKSFISEERKELMSNNNMKLKKKYHIKSDFDSSYYLHSDFSYAFFGDYLKKVNNESRLLEVNCEMGARMAHLAYEYPDIDFYGLDQSIQCATISTHLEGVHIEHYFDIENNPFRSMKFDLITLDCSKIKKDELSKYLSVLKDMLSDTGKLMVLAKNQSYYMNWYPIMMGETKSTFSSDIIYCKDIDEMLVSHDLKVESWIFYFGNVSEDMKSKIEAIQNIVGKDSKFLIESTAYILHK